jgi:hypothetical protein
MMVNAGTAKMDITPRKSIPLAGFGFRKGGFEGISHPIFLRILLIENLLFISGDLLWWDSNKVERLKEQIHRRWEIMWDCIFFCATHSHSGPQTSLEFPFLGQTDEEYLTWMEDQLWIGIDKAISCSEPVTVEHGRSECNIGVFRRKNVNDRIEMGPNYELNVDQEVMVLHFKTLQQKTKAVMVNYACHPTTTGDNRVSSEYTGIAMEQIESELGGDAVSLFLQGCCGDIRPNLVENDQFYRGNDEDVCNLGSKLSTSVLCVLNESMKSLVCGSFQTKTIYIALPLQPIPDYEQLMSDIQSENVSKSRWARLLLDEPNRMSNTRKLEITKIDLFDHFCLMTMNAEMVAEYGNFIKSLAGQHQHIMPVGYCNGMIGYVPTRIQLQEGGYESVDFIYAFGLPSPFAYEIEGIIKKQLIKLIQ